MLHFLAESNDFRSSAAVVTASKRGGQNPFTLVDSTMTGIASYPALGAYGGALGLVLVTPGMRAGGHVLTSGHLERKPSALTLNPPGDHLDLSTCRIFGLREEAERTRIKPTTTSVPTARHSETQ